MFGAPLKRAVPQRVSRSARQQSKRLKEVTNSAEAHSGASDGHGRFSNHTGRKASERRAAREAGDVEADPPE